MDISFSFFYFLLFFFPPWKAQEWDCLVYTGANAPDIPKQFQKFEMKKQPKRSVAVSDDSAYKYFP